MECAGSLVESMSFERTVVGSNPALAGTLDKSFGVKLRHSVNCCYGNVHAVVSAITMDKIIQTFYELIKITSLFHFKLKTLLFLT